MPTFSVIIPVHNDDEHIGDAISSVLAQTVSDLEVIVVDDGSDTPVKAAKDPRIRQLRNRIPLGPAGARNVGISAAAGTFIAFLDSDDLYGPRRLSDVATAHGSADLVIIDSGGPTEATEVDTGRLLWTTTPHVGTLTIRASVLSDLGSFDDGYMACEDVELWTRIAASGASCIRVQSDQFTYRFNDRPRPLHGSTARLEYSRRLLVDHAGYYRTNRRARAFRLRRIHSYLLEQGRLREASAALGAATLAWPDPRFARDLCRTAAAIGRRILPSRGSN